MAPLLALLLLLIQPLSAFAQAEPSPAAAAAKPPPRPAGAPVILVSIDGFRPDYLHHGDTPTLDRLARTGVLADAMRPAFPSITFPNHYTLVTGLYPDHHGIVANTMDDPAVTPDSHFTISDQDAVSDGRWWSGGEPIWVTAKRAGLRTGTLDWPGSEARIGGERPDRFAHFDAAIAPNTRVDMLLDWLSLPPATRPTFFTLYFDDVDHQGHEHGPGSPQVRAAAAAVDRALARLMAGLKARGLANTANLVIVSDHGMQAVTREQVLYVDDWTDPAQVKVLTPGPVAGLSASTPAAEAAILAPHAHVRCWRKGEIPAYLHYGTHPRIPPLYCACDAGWQLTSREQAAKRTKFNVGEHGYDPVATPSMAALFIAHGPAFKTGYRQPAFDNVDVQPLLAHLLGLPRAPVDGSLAPLQGGLVRP